MNISKDIAHLLHQHNCVIVPDFGGFIANYQAAQVDDSRNMIYPPFKSVVFNPKLITNDGLLFNSVAITNACEYNDAVVAVSKQVKEWNHSLNAGDRIEIGELGFLYRENGQLYFEQNRETNLLLTAFGLKAVSFVSFNDEIETTISKDEISLEIKKVVKPEAKAESLTESPLLIQLDPTEKIQEELVVTEEDVIPLPAKKSNKWKYAVAVAAGVPLLFYAYWIPMNTDFLNTGSIQFADFNPIHAQGGKVYSMRTEETQFSTLETSETWEELTSKIAADVKVYNYQFDEDLYIPIFLDQTSTTEEDIQSSGFAYHVIGGCFSVESNASVLVNDLKQQGFTAHILDKSGGLTRVSAGDYSTKSEAEKALSDLKSKGFSGWILHN